MFDVGSFLDRARAGAGGVTDYRLAKLLGINHSNVSNWRTGRSAPDERAIQALCALSGDDAEHVAACIQSMRAANDDAARLWRRVADRLKGGGAASVACLLVVAGLAGAALAPEVQAAPAMLAGGEGLRIMSSVILARLLWRLARLAAIPRMDDGRRRATPAA